MLFNGSDGIFRTAGGVAAMGGKDGADAILVEADKTEQ